MRAALLLLLAGCASTPSAGRPVFECRRAAGPVKLDGLLDEPAWAEALVIDAFRIPGSGRPGTSTRARLLWDAEALYFAAEMEDVDLYATIRERDGRLWENDVFELFFKPSAARPAYYEFQVNAAGAVLDMFLPSRGAGGYGRFVGEGDLGIAAAVRLDGTLNAWREPDRGWTAEGRIPWAGFAATGGAPQAGETWRFALCRFDYSTAHEAPELTSCAPLSAPNFHRYEDYADLRFR